MNRPLTRGLRLFILIIVLTTSVAEAGESKCDLKGLIGKLIALGGKKVEPKSYGNLPATLATALQLRDVYSPMVSELEKKTRSLTPTAISGSIAESNRSNIHFNGVSYGIGFRSKHLMPDTAINAALYIEAQTAYHRLSNQAEFTGKFKEFMTALPRDAENGTPYAELQKTSFPAGTWLSVNPIGAYGPKLAKSLLFTHEILKREIYQDFRSSSPKIYKQNAKLLEEHSGRGHFDKELAPLLAMEEGLTSINQTIGLLLAEKIPGVSDYRDAVRLILRKGNQGKSLATEFSGHLPLAVLGPSNFAGRYFPKALTTDGISVQLSPEFKQTLKAARKEQQAAIEKDALHYGSGLGVGCPIFHTKGCAVEQSGMQTLFDTYLRVFEQVDDQLHPH